MREPVTDRAFGDDNVPAPRRKHFAILSPKPGTEVKAQITSERPIVTWTHFADKTSYPCGRSKADCPFCFRNVEARWKCYLAGVSIITGKAVLIEITHGAGYENPLIRNDKVSLRGRIITLYRTGQAKNSPVHIRIEDAPPTLARAALPLPFDVRTALKLMWGNPWAVFKPGTGQVEDEPPEGQMIPA